MNDPISWLVAADRWPARWHCGDWGDGLAWWYLGGNAGIVLAYYAIPVLLYLALRRRPGLFPDGKAAAWAVVFVVACGTTHLLDALMFWWPAYRLNALARVLTGAVSLYDLWLVWAARRTLRGYKSPAEYEALIRERDAALAAADDERRGKDAALDTLRAEIARKGRQNAKLARAVDEAEKTAVHLRDMGRMRTEADALLGQLREVRRSAV